MTWHDRAWTEIQRLAATRLPFTPDDLLATVGHPDDDHRANASNNQIGSLFREAHAAGIIEQTGTYTKSRQPRRRGGMVAVWQGTTRHQTNTLTLDV